MSGAYSQPLVYFFGQGRAEGTATMKDVLGGKGAGLAEMTNLGIPVPPGFTISSTLCQTYLETSSFPPRLRAQVETALQRLEAATGRQFGGAANPLLVSVRSGAAVSMPGMMETILNLGLNDHTVAGLTTQSNNERFAYDSYRRFIQMYGSVVFELPKQPFEELLDARKKASKADARHRPAGGGAGRPHPRLQGALPEGDREGVPRRPDGPAVGRHRRGIRELEHPPRE